MTLYEFLELSNNDYDVYDSELDECITISLPDEESSYGRFVNELCKRVKYTSRSSAHVLIAEWSLLIRENMELFRAFSRSHWKSDCQPSDDETAFIDEWIRELQGYVSGYVSEDFYDVLVELVLKIDCSESAVTKTTIFEK